jgi:predicted MPP superfamily phosphohydrolase
MRKDKLLKTEYRLGRPAAGKAIALKDAAGLSGLRIAVLPDFHDGDPELVLNMLKKDVPDLIMIPGDFIIGRFPEELAAREDMRLAIRIRELDPVRFMRRLITRKELPAVHTVEVPRTSALSEPVPGELIMDHAHNAIAFLRGCAAIAPTYVSLGNHEYMLTEHDLEKVRKTGVILVDNEWVEVDLAKNGEKQRILVGGLSAHKVTRYNRYRRICRAEGNVDRYPERDWKVYTSIPSDDTEWMADFEAQEGFKILLCHHPEYWCCKRPWLFRRPIDLVLAGHAHGGQIRIGRKHGLFAPGQGLLAWLIEGVHEGPHGCMVITRGVTNSAWPVPRIGTPCELVYLEVEM